MDSIAYKGETFTFILNWFIHMGATLVLWTAVYTSGGEVEGYSLQELIAYYVLVLFVAMITEVYVADDIPNEIKNGEISAWFIRPIGIKMLYLMDAIGNKLVMLLIQMPIFLMGFIIAWLVIFEGEMLPLASVGGLLASGLIAVLAFLLAYLMDMIISACAFWIDKTWSLVHFKNFGILLLGGVSFPLDFATGSFRTFLEILPYKFFYYVPVSYLNGRRDIAEYLLEDMLLLLVWMIIFYLSMTLIWRAGVKKYGAFGG